jgi:DNA helicase-2/ATP-dependent DNA helicase PcrA
MTRDEKSALLESKLGPVNNALTDEQLTFILGPINSACYLKACPGSGKTEVVGIKSAYEISQWVDTFAGLAILSFTKNAAKEIADRVNKYSGVNGSMHPHFIGTIDSWLHGYILQPFGHNVVNYKGNNGDKSIRLVDNESKYDFLTSFRTVLSSAPTYKEAWVNEYYFECTEPVTLQSQSKSLVIDDWNETVKDELKKNKRKFLKAGLATYADAEFLCFHILKGNKSILDSLVKRFPVILIDECQDLSTNQLAILKILAGAGTIFHFIGDPNQSIYEFKKVKIESVNDFIKEYQLKLMLLTKNFRSNQSIVNISRELEKINTMSDVAEINSNTKELVEPACYLWEYEPGEFQQLPQRFINFVNDLNKSIGPKNKSIDIQKSAVLSRSHSTLGGFKSQSMSDLNKIQFFASALNCWDQKPRTGEDMKNSLKQLGKSLSQVFYQGKGNHYLQNCPDCYEAIPWRNELCKILDLALHPDNGLFPFDNLTWSQWAQQLKKFLKNYYINLNLTENDWELVKGVIKAPSGLANKKVIDLLKTITGSFTEKIRLTTIHDAKGESLDAVLVVSSKDKKSKGGHFEHWISKNANEKEFVRFGYVASSRPRHLLIWAVPKMRDRVSIQDVLNLGFSLPQ